MTITILRVDGREEQHETTTGHAFKLIEQLIAAKALDTVNLRDGRIMVVDDLGYEVEVVDRTPPPGYSFAVERVCGAPLKPVNPKATALYHAVCREGVTHAIVGDVAIVRDADFGGDDDDEVHP